MAYFNHAFQKVFLGTHESQNQDPVMAPAPLITAGIDEGFITSIYTDEPNGIRIKTADLQKYGMGPGTFGMFDQSYNIVQTLDDIKPCCPLYLVSASILANDKIGQFHGGYQESNKSKLINPKYIQDFYKVEKCEPQQALVNIGTTPYTSGSILTIDVSMLPAGVGYTDGVYYNVVLNPIANLGYGALATVVVNGGAIESITLTNGGYGYTPGDTLEILLPNTHTAVEPEILTTGSRTGCCKSFYCGETYYLRVDVKGSPTLRALNHMAYQNISAYTGCCPTDIPTLVDPTTVYITWATGIVENNYLKNFVAPVVFDYTGVAWYAPGTTITMDGTATPVTAAQWWTNYSLSPQAAAWTDATPCTAGMRLYGAFVETKFENCSFQTTDFFEKEPVRIYASLVDYNGDPCTFEGLCVYREECLGVQGMGFGEQVVRDLIQSERYLQNFFHSDIRIREITQGNQILNSVNRNALYTRYCILHSVPRFNNPSGLFDNDRYLLEIITNNKAAKFEVFMNTWLDTCTQCVSMTENSCNSCDVLPDAGFQGN